MVKWIRRFPAAAYFILAFILTWMVLPFASASMAVGMIALFGPAVAALITAFACGPGALQDFRLRLVRWKVPIHWYLVALTIPFAVSLMRTGLETWAGASGPVQMQPVSALELIVFVMVFGEEAGWRGFALPHLRSRFDLWTSSAIVGVLWAFWHLPLFFMPGMPQYQHPFLPYIGYLIALSIILTWLTERAQGSVVVATVFHGAVNTLGIINADAGSTMRGWANFAGYATVAVIIGVVAWRRSPHTFLEPGSV